jgi:lambda repressor-like predicted transcriptional regulator
MGEEEQEGAERMAEGRHGGNGSAGSTPPAYMMRRCAGCCNWARGQCRVFTGAPIPGSDGRPCRAEGWDWTQAGEGRLVPVRHEALQAALETRGISKYRLSLLAQMDTTTLYTVMSGEQQRMSAATLGRVAEVLRVPLEAIGRVEKGEDG